MIDRRALLLAATLSAVACAAPADRGYYAPVGVELGPTLASWEREENGVRFEVRCQGVYLNQVDGQDTRTAHVQMELARTGSGELTLPLSEMRVNLLSEESDDRAVIEVAEAWSGRHRAGDALVVPAWSRRSFDLFFDTPWTAGRAPDAVRLRFRYDVEGEGHRLECQFRRIPDDDPRLPGLDTEDDTEFGIRDGYYLVGWDDLGDRGLRESEEMRQHYLFHDPDSWIF